MTIPISYLLQRSLIVLEETSFSLKVITVALALLTMVKLPQTKTVGSKKVNHNHLVVFFSAALTLYNYTEDLQKVQ